jgi:saccharopine dehydrogenase-like NADP-dependent oxidoreductase
MKDRRVKHQMNALRILLVGASGNFGARLARLLVKERGIVLVACGRNAATLAALTRELGCETLLSARDQIDVATLTAHQIALVIDTSGPFQTASTHLIDTAIAAGCHYIDIADDRAWVAGIGRHDAAAKAAGAAVIAGASSTPAVSHAAIAAITKGWQRIDSIDVTISPSNRQKRGPAVVEAILVGVGQTFRLFDRGGWQAARGWSGLRRITMPHVGKRWASLCDTPDHDALVSSFAPRHAARFYAGLELTIMHVGLSVLSTLVTTGLMRTLVPLATPLRMAADLLQPFGNDMGGMVAEASGCDAKGNPARARWWLAAKGAIGPNVPILAALELTRQLRDANFGRTGAMAATGLVSLDQLAGDFASLGMTTGFEQDTLPVPVFEQALGNAYDRMPAVTQALHRPGAGALWQGEGTAEGGRNILARAFAKLFRLPATHGAMPVAVTITPDADGRERWARHWPGQIMRSTMSYRGPGVVTEGFGPFAFDLAITPHAEGLDMLLARGRLWGLPWPKALCPQIAATERADMGRHYFDVAIVLPIIGQLVRYHGWLRQV